MGKLRRLLGRSALMWEAQKHDLTVGRTEARFDESRAVLLRPHQLQNAAELKQLSKNENSKKDETCAKHKADQRCCCGRAYVLRKLSRLPYLTHYPFIKFLVLISMKIEHQH